MHQEAFAKYNEINKKTLRTTVATVSRNVVVIVENIN